MVNIDPSISMAVWERVGTGGGSNSLEQVLADFLNNARNSREIFRQIYRNSRGALRPPMERLFRLSRNQVHRLETLYFLTTGTTLPMIPELPPAEECLTKQLQQQYEASQLNRESSLAASGQFPKFSRFFQNFAEQEGQIQRILANLVSSRL